jgi:uncharacterized protein YbjT (DUF2867 family)
VDDQQTGMVCAEFQRRLLRLYRIRELRLPAGDGAATFVDADDIAAVVVAALAEDGRTGQPSAVSIKQAAAAISAVAGREVSYFPLSIEDYVAELVA